LPLMPCVASAIPDGKGGGSAAVRVVKSVDCFRLTFAYTEPMFQGPPNQASFVIRCKGCGENVPAPVETLAASWIAAKCPLCGEHRRYLPTEIFRGRLSYALLRRPVRSAQGGAR
jgi:hypothetical protein